MLKWFRLIMIYDYWYVFFWAYNLILTLSTTKKQITAVTK